MQRKYYGQFDPPLDELLYERYFKNNIAVVGVGIECGASDGSTESSLRFFEESLGWDVVNVECAPPLLDKLCKNRPLSRNVNYALSSGSGSVGFIHAVSPVYGEIFGNGSLSHADVHRQQLLNDGCSFKEYQVESVTYNQLVAEQGLSDVDLLVLDVEGHELEVLIGMEGSSAFPSVICVESTITDKAAIRKLLESYGYCFSEDLYNNSVYVRNSALKIACRDEISTSIRSINIVTNLRASDAHAESFFRQVANLSQNQCVVANLIITVAGDDSIIEAAAKRFLDIPLHIIREVDLAKKPVSLADRARQWAGVGNGNLRLSTVLGADATLIIESDLCFPMDLLDLLCAKNDAVIAPVVLLGTQFYDTWGFRAETGDRIISLNSLLSMRMTEGYARLGSVGSCALFPQQVLEMSVRMPPTYDDGLFVGLCRGARLLGFDVFCDLRVSIMHPVSTWRRQLWTVSKVIVGSPLSAETVTVDLERHNLVVADRYAEFSRDIVRAVLNQLFGAEKVGALVNRLQISVAAIEPSRSITVFVCSSGSPPEIGDIVFDPPVALAGRA